MEAIAVATPLADAAQAVHPLYVEGYKILLGVPLTTYEFMSFMSSWSFETHKSSTLYNNVSEVFSLNHQLWTHDGKIIYSLQSTL